MLNIRNTALLYVCILFFNFPITVDDISYYFNDRIPERVNIIETNVP